MLIITTRADTNFMGHESTLRFAV